MFLLLFTYEHLNCSLVGLRNAGSDVFVIADDSQCVCRLVSEVSSNHSEETEEALCSALDTAVGRTTAIFEILAVCSQDAPNLPALINRSNRVV
jgi:hypothetical protein